MVSDASASRAVIAGLVLLTACGPSRSDAEVTAAVEPIGTTAPTPERAADTVAPPPVLAAAADMAPTPPAPPPAPRVCRTGGAPIDARQALMTVGNVHVYLEVEGFYDAFWPPLVVEERVVEARRYGRYGVARVERRVVDCRGSTAECAGAPTPLFPIGAFLRVSEGGALWRVSSDDALPRTQREVTDLLDDAEVEVPRARGRLPATPLCLAIGCARFSAIAQTTAQGGLDTVEARSWPGVGLAAWSRQSYSADSGDGSTSYRILLGYSVEGPVAPLGTLGPEPTELTAIREAVHALAVRGDAAALAAYLLSDAEDGGAQPSLSPDDRGDVALTSWGADGGLALSRLATITAEPCAAIGVDVVCPRAEAERMASIHGCEQGRVTTVPRAMFVRARAGWRLMSMLSGGDDDLLYHPIWSAGPALPYSMRASFDHRR